MLGLPAGDSPQVSAELLTPPLVCKGMLALGLPIGDSPQAFAELVTPLLICKGSQVLGLPAGDSSSGLWGDLSLNPGGVQALIPRQAAELVNSALVCKGSPVLGLPAGDSFSGFWGAPKPQPMKSAGSTGTHSQADSAKPQPRKECRQCRCSFPGRLC